MPASVPITDAERKAIQFYYDRTGNARIDFRKLSRKEAAKSSLQDIWTLMRVAGILGRKAAMLKAAAEARSKIKDLRAIPAEFEPHSRLIAGVMMDLGRPGFAGDDLLRFIPETRAVPALRQTAKRIYRSRQLLGALFSPINRFLEGVDTLHSLEEADLGLIAPLHIIAQGGNTETELPATLLTVLSLTVELAQAAGLKVSLIPDFLLGVMERRPAHVLSFHTAGQLPGFVHFKKADLPDYLLVDTGGYSGWSSLAGKDLTLLDLPPLDESNEICDRLYKDIVLNNVSKYRQPENVDAPLPSRYVFVALQGPLIDAPHLVRFDTEAMLQMIIDRFRGSDTAVVVKLHPKVNAVGIIGWLLAQAETGAIILREDSIHTLVAGAEAVMTINSGVGSEAMIHRKPIFCFGGCDYDAIAHRIESVEQFNDLTTPIRPAVSENDLSRFIAYYRTKYLIDRSQSGRLESALQERVIDPIVKAPNLYTSEV